MALNLFPILIAEIVAVSVIGFVISKVDNDSSKPIMSTGQSEVVKYDDKISSLQNKFNEKLAMLDTKNQDDISLLKKQLREVIDSMRKKIDGIKGIDDATISQIEDKILNNDKITSKDDISKALNDIINLQSTTKNLQDEYLNLKNFIEKTKSNLNNVSREPVKPSEETLKVVENVQKLKANSKTNEDKIDILNKKLDDIKTKSNNISPEVKEADIADQDKKLRLLFDELLNKKNKLNEQQKNKNDLIELFDVGNEVNKMRMIKEEILKKKEQLLAKSDTYNNQKKVILDKGNVLNDKIDGIVRDDKDALKAQINQIINEVPALDIEDTSTIVDKINNLEDAINKKIESLDVLVKANNESISNFGNEILELKNKFENYFNDKKNNLEAFISNENAKLNEKLSEVNDLQNFISDLTQSVLLLQKILTDYNDLYNNNDRKANVCINETVKSSSQLDNIDQVIENKQNPNANKENDFVVTENIIEKHKEEGLVTSEAQKAAENALSSLDAAKIATEAAGVSQEAATKTKLIADSLREEVSQMIQAAQTAAIEAKNAAAIAEEATKESNRVAIEASTNINKNNEEMSLAKSVTDKALTEITDAMTATLNAAAVAQEAAIKAQDSIDAFELSKKSTEILTDLNDKALSSLHEAVASADVLMSKVAEAEKNINTKKNAINASEIENRNEIQQLKEQAKQIYTELEKSKNEVDIRDESAKAREEAADSKLKEANKTLDEVKAVLMQIRISEENLAQQTADLLKTQNEHTIISNDKLNEISEQKKAFEEHVQEQKKNLDEAFAELQNKKEESYSILEEHKNSIIKASQKALDKVNGKKNANVSNIETNSISVQSDNTSAQSNSVSAQSDIDDTEEIDDAKYLSILKLNDIQHSKANIKFFFEGLQKIIEIGVGKKSDIDSEKFIQSSADNININIPKYVYNNQLSNLILYKFDQLNEIIDDKTTNKYLYPLLILSKNNFEKTYDLVKNYYQPTLLLYHKANAIVNVDDTNEIDKIISDSNKRVNIELIVFIIKNEIIELEEIKNNDSAEELQMITDIKDIVPDKVYVDTIAYNPLDIKYKSSVDDNKRHFVLTGKKYDNSQVSATTKETANKIQNQSGGSLKKNKKNHKGGFKVDDLNTAVIDDTFNIDDIDNYSLFDHQVSKHIDEGFEQPEIVETYQTNHGDIQKLTINPIFIILIVKIIRFINYIVYISKNENIENINKALIFDVVISFVLIFLLSFILDSSTIELLLSDIFMSFIILTMINLVFLNKVSNTDNLDKVNNIKRKLIIISITIVIIAPFYILSQ